MPAGQRAVGCAPAARGEAELDGLTDRAAGSVAAPRAHGSREVVAGLLVDDERPRPPPPRRPAARRGLRSPRAARRHRAWKALLRVRLRRRRGLEEVVPRAAGGAGGLVVAVRRLGRIRRRRFGPSTCTARIGRRSATTGSGRSGGPRARRAVSPAPLRTPRIRRHGARRAGSAACPTAAAEARRKPDRCGRSPSWPARARRVGRRTGCRTSASGGARTAVGELPARPHRPGDARLRTVGRSSCCRQSCALRRIDGRTTVRDARLAAPGLRTSPTPLSLPSASTASARSAAARGPVGREPDAVGGAVRARRRAETRRRP